MAMPPLADWQNFYVIAGSSAGALIGLQFVVLSLIAAARPATRANAAAGRAFSTPTIVYFGTVLLMAGILTAPWASMRTPAWLAIAVGVAGIVYAVTVTRSIHGQGAYRPQIEDWLFHCWLPVAAYVILAVSAAAALKDGPGPLFGLAAAALLLLFIGIHNAWDAVTYHVFDSTPRSDDRSEQR